MRCQPYFATKTAAAMPSIKKAIAPMLTITGSTVRRRVIEVPLGAARSPLSAATDQAPRRVRYSWGAGGWCAGATLASSVVFKSTKATHLMQR